MENLQVKLKYLGTIFGIFQKLEKCMMSSLGMFHEITPDTSQLLLVQGLICAANRGIVETDTIR